MGLGNLLKKLGSKASMSLVAGALAAMTSFGNPYIAKGSEGTQEADKASVAEEEPQVEAQTPTITSTLTPTQTNPFSTEYFLNPITLPNRSKVDDIETDEEESDDVTVYFDADFSFGTNDFRYTRDAFHLDSTGLNGGEFSDPEKLDFATKYLSTGNAYDSWHLRFGPLIDIHNAGQVPIGLCFIKNSRTSVNFKTDEFELGEIELDNFDFSEFTLDDAYHLMNYYGDLEENKLFLSTVADLSGYIGYRQAFWVSDFMGLAFSGQADFSYRYGVSKEFFPELHVDGIDLDNFDPSELSLEELAAIENPEVKFREKTTTVNGGRIGLSVGASVIFPPYVRIDATVDNLVSAFISSDSSNYRFKEEEYEVEGVGDPLSFNLSVSAELPHGFNVRMTLWDLASYSRLDEEAVVGTRFNPSVSYNPVDTSSGYIEIGVNGSISEVEQGIMAWTSIGAGPVYFQLGGGYVNNNELQSQYPYFTASIQVVPQNDQSN